MNQQEMEQNLKDFLNFGASDILSKKELWKCHLANLFFTALLIFAMHIMETPIWTQIFLFLLWISGVILTNSRQEICGKRIFFTYGIISLQMEVLFFSGGTFFLSMISWEKRTWHFVLAGIIFLFFLLHIGYFWLTFYLVRKGAYKATKKASGGISFLAFASLGIFAGKLLSALMEQNAVICFTGFLMYFLVALLALGSMNLFKYVLYRKYEQLEEERQRKEQAEKEQRRLEKAKKRKRHGKKQLVKQEEQ